MKMEQVQFVTAIHGNEPLPVLALASLGIDQIVANPKALSRNVRSVEKDMNASFGTDGHTYEEKRAREVLSQLNRKKLVIDLHTFSAYSEPFVVIVDLKMFNFAKTLGFKNIVYMKHNIKKGHALINYQKGVSIEFGKHNDPESFRRVVDLICRLKKGISTEKEVMLYEVYGVINKPGKYENFKLHEDGFVPILAGENAYDFYGLKARKMNL